MLASRIAGIPYSFTAHGPDEFERAGLLSLDIKLKRATFAVCVSSFGRSQLMRWSSPDQWHKIAVIHCGVDHAYMGSSVNPPPMVSRFVCVGRLSDQKAQLVLVAAVCRLRDVGIQLEIVLAGDGPMRPVIEDAIRRAGLESQITITGWITGERVRAEIASARALVLPSFSENLPVVIMEAMALGRPVISTYVAGIPELVQPEKTGWLVPAGDVVALSGALREALEATVEKLTNMGTMGKSRIIENHDSLKEAAKLKCLFEGNFSIIPYGT
jgi:colanic acid/amylovoran biosynthesis glycosyltransferase